MAAWIGKNFEVPWRWRQTFVRNVGNYI